MRNKKIFVFIPLTLLAVFLVSFFFMNKKNVGGQLFQSDIIATNIMHAVPGNTNDVRFFSGSNSAQLSIETPARSTSQTPTIPMDVTLKVAWYSGGALVKVNQLADSSYLLTKVPDPLLYKNNTSWWKLTNTGPVLFSAPGIPSNDIYDIHIDESGTMHVVYQDVGSGKYGVARYSAVDNGRQTLKTPATYELPSIIGGDSANTYFRDASGAIYDNSGNKIISKSYGAKYDEQNKHIVYSSIEGSESTNEGAGEGGIAKNTSFSIYSYSSRTAKPKKLGITPSGEFFVSKGVVFIPIANKDSQNKLLVVRGSSVSEYSVTVGKQPLSGLDNIILNKESEFLVVDSDGNLSIISDNESLIASQPSAKLIKTNKREVSIPNGLIYYDLTDNTADVILFNTVSSDITTAIVASKNSIEAELGDINQVKITWILSAPPSGEAGLD